MISTVELSVEPTDPLDLRPPPAPLSAEVPGSRFSTAALSTAVPRSRFLRRTGLLSPLLHEP